MTSGSGDFLIGNNIYPNKAYNDQDVTLAPNTVVTINVSDHFMCACYLGCQYCEH